MLNKLTFAYQSWSWCECDWIILGQVKEQAVISCIQVTFDFRTDLRAAKIRLYACFISNQVNYLMFQDTRNKTQMLRSIRDKIFQLPLAGVLGQPSMLAITVNLNKVQGPRSYNWLDISSKTRVQIVSLLPCIIAKSRPCSIELLPECSQYIAAMAMHFLPSIPVPIVLGQQSLPPSPFFLARLVKSTSLVDQDPTFPRHSKVPPPLHS